MIKFDYKIALLRFSVLRNTERLHQPSPVLVGRFSFGWCLFLWPEMLRVIREAQPTWVVGENVGGIYTVDNGVVFENVCLDLEAEGYEVQPICIPASAKGAPHRRDRWWFIANTVRLGRERRGAAGNNHRERAIHKDIADYGSEVRSEIKRGYCDATDTSSTRLQATRTEQPTTRVTRDSAFTWGNDWLEVATAFCRVDDGLPRGLDKYRKHRIEALGNAIVPQVAEQIFRGML